MLQLLRVWHFSVLCCRLPRRLSKSADKWVTAWAASAQGPYPSGNAILQPDMHRAFPSPETGAKDQSFRLIVGPDIWGREARIRLSNAFGTKPITFDGVYIGMQLGSSAVAAGTNRPVTFGGSQSVTVEPGQSAWSDAVALPFVADARPIDLQGRKLAVSFHIAGESGPMTWHAKGLTTSYVTRSPALAPTARRKMRPAFPSAPRPGISSMRLDMKVAPETQAHRRLWRLAHRWHRLDVEWRRPLAGCALAAASCEVRRQVRRRECRHRRQPDHRPRGIQPANALSGRACGAAAARTRRPEPVRRLHGDLVRGDQRLQQERQCQRRSCNGMRCAMAWPRSGSAFRACA